MRFVHIGLLAKTAYLAECFARGKIDSFRDLGAVTFGTSEEGHFSGPVIHHVAFETVVTHATAQASDVVAEPFATRSVVGLIIWDHKGPSVLEDRAIHSVTARGELCV